MQANHNTKEMLSNCYGNVASLKQAQLDKQRGLLDWLERSLIPYLYEPIQDNAIGHPRMLPILPMFKMYWLPIVVDMGHSFITNQ